MKSNWDKLRQENANVVADVQQLADRQQALTDFQVNLNQQQIAIAQKYQHNFDGLQQLLNDRKDLATVAYKVGDAASRVDEIVVKYADDFKTATKLKKKDFIFLFTATALQVVRQLAFSKHNNYRSSDRLDDQAAANKEGHGGKYDRSTRGSGYYHATVEEMLNNSVPFDTQNASALFGENLGGGWGHRFHTLGHDPILGWIFGTANIATRTVTMSDIVSSYHVRYDQYMTGNQTLNDAENYQDETLSEFSVNKHDREKIANNIQNIVRVVGFKGLIEKYGLKDIDEVKAAQLAAEKAHAKIEAEKRAFEEEKAKFQAEQERKKAETKAKEEAAEQAKVRKKRLPQ